MDPDATVTKEPEPEPEPEPPAPVVVEEPEPEVAPPPSASLPKRSAIPVPDGPMKIDFSKYVYPTPPVLKLTKLPDYNMEELLADFEVPQYETSKCVVCVGGGGHKCDCILNFSMRLCCVYSTLRVSVLALLSANSQTHLRCLPLHMCRLLANPPPSLTFSPNRMATTSAAISFIVSQIASSDQQACISALRQVCMCKRTLKGSVVFMCGPYL